MALPKIDTSMAPRTGRPRTGRVPDFIARMNPTDSAAERQAARGAGKLVGQWLEEGIREKIEWECSDEQGLDEAGGQGVGNQPGKPLFDDQREAGLEEGFVPAIPGGC